VAVRNLYSFNPEDAAAAQEKQRRISELGLNSEIAERLDNSRERSVEVYGDHAIVPDANKIYEAWAAKPEFQIYYDQLEAEGKAPEIIISAKNLPIDDWQDIYEPIATNQPEDAPNQLEKDATDGIGLWFKSNTSATNAYNQLYPDQTEIEWEITVIPTKGGYKDSGITNVKTEYKDIPTDITPPTLGALLTYYASHLIRREEFPEAAFSWCAETDGSDALRVGFFSIDRRVRVYWVGVGDSSAGLGVSASVRGEVGD
jgi:hypothetical protein